MYSINCLFFFFFSLTHTLSHFYPASYIQMQMQNPPGHIFVYTYVRTPSATAARRSNVFLHHQEGFCVINTRFQVKLPIGIRAWKNNKNKAAAESVFKQKKKSHFSEMTACEHIRGSESSASCVNATVVRFQPSLVCLASSPSTTAQQARLRPGAKPHPAPVMLLLCGHGILNPTRLFAFTRHVAVSRQGGSMGRTIVFV